MMRSAGALAALLVLIAPAAAPADPAVRALATRPAFGGGPALVDGHVVFARPRADALRVLRAPAAGGAPTELARAPLPPSPIRGPVNWELAAGPDGLAIRVTRGASAAALWAGPLAGPLMLVQRRSTPGATMFEDRDLFAVAGGPLVLERTDRVGARFRAVLRPPGVPARRVALPAGADLRHVAVAGGVAALAVPRRRELVFVALPSGEVVERRPLGPWADALLLGLAVSAGGDVALTAEGDGGADFLGWAPAGSAEPRVVASGDGFGHVSTANGRIAFTRPVRNGDGEHVIVLDMTGPEPREIFRGPPAGHVRHLHFDGAHVAWSTDGCQLVAGAEPAASAERVPAGPCVRTEAAFGLYDGDRLRRTVRLGVRCLTAPGRRCGIDVRLYAPRRVARRVTSVAVGRRRIVHVRLTRRALARLREGGDVPLLVARVVDPGGRGRVAFTVPL